jgi:hypothetical protein
MRGGCRAAPSQLMRRSLDRRGPYLSHISKIIDTIIRNGLAQELRAAGYRKTGRTWRRGTGVGIRVTNLQASWTNVGDSGTFTINLGCWFPDAARIHGGFRVTERPTESDCIVSQRIGRLFPDGLDHWWKVDPDTDSELLGHQVARAWKTYGMPWLEAHSDPRAARQFMVDRGFLWWGAIFSLMLNEPAEARNYLDAALAEAADAPSVLRILQDWRKRTQL